MEGIAGTLLRQLRQAFYQYGFFGVLSWSYQTFGFVVGVLLPISLLGCILFLVLYRYNNRKKYKGPQQLRAMNPVFISLHKMLNRMDRRVKAAGQRRHHKTQARGFGQKYRTGISNTQISATAEKSLPNNYTSCLRNCETLYKKNSK